MTKCLNCDFLQTGVKQGYCCAACPLGRGHGPWCRQLKQISFSDESTVVVIPYRNRPEHLTEFINVVLRLFHENNIRLLVVEQSQNFDFNRGALLNIGVKELPDMQWYIFHDVDTLPNKSIVQYSYRPSLNFPYDIERLRQPHAYSFGNICKFSQKSLKLMNGHPNNIWGWGVEDRALYFRYLKMSRMLKLKHFSNVSGWRTLPHDSSHRKYTKETKSLSRYYWDRNKIHSSSYLNDGITTVRYRKYKNIIKTHLYFNGSGVSLCMYAHIYVELEKQPLI